MALTRKMLEAMGIETDKAELIIAAHTETVDALKAQRDNYKTEAEKLPGVQAELDGYKNGEDYKAKYDTLKSQIDGEKAQAAKETAARAYLKEKGITDEKSLKLAMRGATAEIAGITLKDGKIEDTKSLDALLSGDFSGLITQTTTEGTQTDNPAGTSGGKNYGEIYKKDDKGRYVMSASERQKAIAEKLANESE